MWQPGAVAWILQAGLDPFMRDADGLSAAQVATKCCKSEAVTVLQQWITTSEYWQEGSML